MVSGLRLLSLVIPAWLMAGWVPSCQADLTEDQAKASLIYNLTKFVQWPQPPQDRVLNLCVYRDDPVLDSLSTLGDKTSKGMALRVRKTETAAEAQTCQVLFVGRGEQAGLGFMRQAMAGKEVLLVSDIPGSAAAGAMVEILLEGRHIAFKINKKAATEANLRLSAQLLSLAKTIYEK